MNDENNSRIGEIVVSLKSLKSVDQALIYIAHELIEIYDEVATGETLKTRDIVELVILKPIDQVEEEEFEPEDLSNLKEKFYVAHTLFR